MPKNLGTRTSQEIKAEVKWWQKQMLEASLICARMGLIEDALALKVQADYWGNWRQAENKAQPSPETAKDPDFQDFIDEAVKAF